MRTFRNTDPTIACLPNPSAACRQVAVAQHLLKQSGRRLPDMLGYLVNPAEVVILLPHRTRAPEGFQELDDGYAWLLTKSAAKELAREQQNQKYLGQKYLADDQLLDPMVIQAGIHLKTQMLLDISQISHLSVKGATERVISAMGSFTMDLLSNPFRSDLRIYIVGFGHEFEMFPQVSVFERQSDVSNLLRADANGGGTAVKQLEIVMDPFTENPDKFEDGVSHITSFGSATWSLDLERNRLHPYDIPLQRGQERSSSMVPYSTFQKLLPRHDEIEPVAMRLDSQNGALVGIESVTLSGASPSTMPGAVSLSETSPNAPVKSNMFKSNMLKPKMRNMLPSGKPKILSHSKSEKSKGLPWRPRFLWRATPRDIRICVLGPVKIEGAAPFLTQQCSDFVCYLAFHREGVTCDMVKESMWSNGSTPETRTVTALASRSRAALGTDAMYRHHIPRFGTDRIYRLSQNVHTDFDELHWHLRRVRSNSPAAIVHLRRALRLVRGAPFSGSGRNRYGWADMSVRAHIECLVDDSAHSLADIALRLGDPDTARWACYQAHKVVPGCEQCYLRRFQVAYLAGNPTELRSAMSELQQIIRTDDGFCVSTALTQSYNKLLDAMSE